MSRERLDRFDAGRSGGDFNHAVFVASRPLLAQLDIPLDPLGLRRRVGVFQQRIKLEAHIAVVALGFAIHRQKDRLRLPHQLVGHLPSDLLVAELLGNEFVEIAIESPRLDQVGNDDRIRGRARGAQRMVAGHQFRVDRIEPKFRPTGDQRFERRSHSEAPASRSKKLKRGREPGGGSPPQIATISGVSKASPGHAPLFYAPPAKRQAAATFYVRKIISPVRVSWFDFASARPPTRTALDERRAVASNAGAGLDPREFGVGAVDFRILSIIPVPSTARIPITEGTESWCDVVSMVTVGWPHGPDRAPRFREIARVSGIARTLRIVIALVAAASESAAFGQSFVGSSGSNTPWSANGPAFVPAGASSRRNAAGSSARAMRRRRDRWGLR